MKFKGLRWYAAAAMAFLMGLPLAERAEAGDGSEIFNAVMHLVDAIVDVAGDS